MASLVVGAEQRVKVNKITYVKRKDFSGKKILVRDEKGRELWRICVREGKGNNDFILRSGEEPTNTITILWNVKQGFMLYYQRHKGEI